MIRRPRYRHERTCHPFAIDSHGNRWGICTCSDEFVAADVLADSRAEGCTCEPELEVERLGNGDHHVEVRHDAWCALGCEC